MTAAKIHHPKVSMSSHYLSRKEGGHGLYKWKTIQVHEGIFYDVCNQHHDGYGNLTKIILLLDSKILLNQK